MRERDSVSRTFYFGATEPFVKRDPDMAFEPMHKTVSGDKPPGAFGFVEDSSKTYVSRSSLHSAYNRIPAPEERPLPAALALFPRGLRA